MALALRATFDSAGELRAFLAAQQQQGAALLALQPLPDGIAQYAPLQLLVEAAELRCALAGSVLQTIAGVGLVVRLEDTAVAEALVADAPLVAAPAAPRVALVTEQPAPADEEPIAGERGARGAAMPAGMGPLSWPIERLQAEFAGLSIADKVRVAKYGKRPARMVVMRQQDKTLHAFLLSNHGLTAEEVAALAGMASAEHALLQRIAGSPDWLRHTSVVRNLVCNPKLAIPEVIALLRHLPAEELRRLAKTGRVRAAVKRELVRFLDRGSAR